MAVIIDSGEKEDIHPQNKKPVGERLALLAAKLDDPSIQAESPLFKSEKRVDGKVQVVFANVAPNLTYCSFNE